MDNLSSYSKDSGFGENPKLEQDIIRNFFGDRIVSLEQITDKERQVKGIDYIVKYKNWKGEIEEKKIDTKIHHYDSEIFVFEFDDDRPNYQNRTWGSAEKETDLLFWIIPGCNKYAVYSEDSLKEFRNSTNWCWYNNEEFMNVKHFNYGKYIGKTYNKWLPINFTVEIGKRSFSRTFDMGGYYCKVKESKFYFEPLTKTFRKKLF